MKYSNGIVIKQEHVKITVEWKENNTFNSLSEIIPSHLQKPKRTGF